MTGMIGCFTAMVGIQQIWLGLYSGTGGGGTNQGKALRYNKVQVGNGFMESFLLLDESTSYGLVSHRI